MSVKESLFNAMLHELTVCQHLHKKIKASDANWRPAENMRSTVELMGYLSYIGKTTLQHFVENPEDRTLYFPKVQAMNAYVAENVTFENFPDMIEEEKVTISRAFANWTEEEILTSLTYYPWSKQDCSLFDGLNKTLLFLATYRHQLFLYAKMQGATIGTSNNWGGMDMPSTIPAAVQEAVEEDAS